MRSVALLVALGVVLGVLSVPASGASADVSISGVEVAPQQPAPGDLVTVAPTIQNLPTSPSAVDITAVALRTGEGRRFDELARVTDLGTLAPGGSLRVPLTVRFDRAGVKQLRVVVYARAEDGQRVTVQYPVTVPVRRQGPGVDIAVERAVADAPTAANVTVSNGLDTPIRNVRVSLGGENVTANPTRRVQPAVAAGTVATFPFVVRAAGAGPHALTARLTYETPDGTVRTVTRRETVDFETLSAKVAVDARSTPGVAAATAVTVTNLGNAPVHNLTVTVSAPNATAARAFLPGLVPRSARTVRLNLTGVRGTVETTVRATYDVGDRHGQTETTVDLAARPGRIELTGIDVQREGDRYHVTGSASNVGLSAAQSVVVRVVPTENVTPAYPNREYFVGTVPPSDFVVFDVFATVQGSPEHIPLNVTYLVGGERRSRLVEVPFEAVVSPPPPGQGAGSAGNGGGLLLPAVVAGVVVLALVLVALYAWRSTRAAG